MPGDSARQNGKLGGRPPGALSRTTISANEQKAIAREVIRQAVIERIPDIVAAHVENALGIPYMTLRREDGSFCEATDEQQVKRELADGAVIHKVYTRQPHQPSAAMLLAYVADKPVEPMEITGAEGGPLVVMWAGDVKPEPENP